MSERAAPQYCPYCGDEDLRPEPTSHRAWHCRGCARVFEVSFVGLKLGADSSAVTASAAAAPVITASAPATSGAAR